MEDQRTQQQPPYYQQDGRNQSIPPPQKDSSGSLLKVLLGTVIALVTLMSVGAVVLLVSQSKVSTHINRSTSQNTSSSNATTVNKDTQSKTTTVVQPQTQTTTVVQQAPPVATSRPTPVSGMKFCDQNIQVDAESTTCGLGENTFKAYWDTGNSVDGWHDATVSANSPKTGQNYSMNCTTDRTTVGCTGTAGSSTLSVQFPMSAVTVYH